MSDQKEIIAQLRIYEAMIEKMTERLNTLEAKAEQRISTLDNISAQIKQAEENRQWDHWVACLQRGYCVML